MTLRTPPHVMVYQYEQAALDLFSGLLERSGMRVRRASSAQEAFDALKSPAGRDIKVVVCPGPQTGDKRSMIAKIRGDDDLSKVPVVCLSPTPGLVQIAHAYTAGASDVVVLPVSQKALHDRVMKQVRRGVHQDVLS